MTLNKILFASDLSERAERAGHRAAQLAEHHNARLEALHVIETDSPGLRALSSSPNAKGVFQAAAEQQLQASTPGQKAEIRVVIGDILGEIVYAAEHGHVDLLVVGAHGQHHVRDWVLGTTAEQLVSHTPTPTLVVRHPAETPYQRVAVAVDFSECSRQALEAARNWFPEAELYVLHVLDTTDLDRMLAAGIGDSFVQEQQDRLMAEAQQELESFVAGTGAITDQVHMEVHAGYPATVAENVLESLEADLVVLGNHGRGRWANVLLGSVAGRLLRELSSDLLVIREQERA